MVKKILMAGVALLFGFVVGLLIVSGNVDRQTDAEIERIDNFIKEHKNGNYKGVSDIISTDTVDYVDYSCNVDNTSVKADVQTVEREIISDYELSLLAYQVYGEVGICGDDYYADYLQACVVLNRIKRGWGNSISEVIYQEGQFETWWYEQLMQTEYPDDLTWQAVYDALRENTTPETLVYADSRSGVPEGCYLYYESWTGQRFYCEVE